MRSVSAIVPAFNYGRYLSAAIDSALAQTYPLLELVVVDDGSTDETAAVLASYGERVRVLRQDNRGPAAARNAGIAAARGELLAFLDADDGWHPRKLELQVERLAAEPAPGLVHCGMERIDGSGRTLGVATGGHEGWIADTILRLEEGVIGPPSTWLVPRRIVEETGGFDERLLSSEDWDLAYRIARRHPFGYVPLPLTRYREHGGGVHHDVPRLESSWMLALDKAFTRGQADVQPLRRHSYGRLHRILAGCYFQARRPLRFLRHAVQSVRHDPRNLGYFASFPLRALGRAAGR
jgi:glycosyltransferase involved in cell wall biosynthesis